MSVEIKTPKRRGRPSKKDKYDSIRRINLSGYYAREQEIKNENPPTKCTRCDGPMIPGYEDATCLYCGEYWCAARNDKSYGTEFPPHGEKVG